MRSLARLLVCLIAAASVAASPSARAASPTATRASVGSATRAPGGSATRGPGGSATRAPGGSATRSSGSPRHAAGAPAIGARAPATAAGPAATAAGPAAIATQARKLEAGKAALERLAKDPRRRKYRDGWESVARDLDAAVRIAPAGPRAAEAGLFAARAREDLWNVSRAKVDARAALQAYRKVDDSYPRTDEAARALSAAVRLGTRVGEAKEAQAAARRLLGYPRSTEVTAALALVPRTSRAGDGPPTHDGVPSAGRQTTADSPRATSERARAAPADAARSAVPADRAAHAPAELEEDDVGPEAAASVSERAAAPGAKGGLRPLNHATPLSPEREPDTDVPAEAARILDALVRSARASGSEDLLGQPAPNATAPNATAPITQTTPAPAGQADPAAAPVHDGALAVAEEQEGAEAEPPEPEAPEEAPIALPHRTRASAPRPGDDEPDPDAARKARELRSALLSDKSASLAAELGLKVRRVVVDAGHGGRDTGAIGPHGLREKDVSLSIARKVAAQLRRLGLAVVLTRDADAYVGLDERTRIANEAHADLFVSIHCNAAKKRKLSGVETWTLNVASDHYARRLAAFENAEAERTVSDLRLILADLATKANANDARELAVSVQSSLVRGLRSGVGKVKDHGVKQALFYVLLGTHMPSILVETAFLSNPEEEKRLRSAKYQDGTAVAIARGVHDFLDAQKKLARAP